MALPVTRAVLLILLQSRGASETLSQASDWDAMFAQEFLHVRKELHELGSECLHQSHWAIDRLLPRRSCMGLACKVSLDRRALLRCERTEHCSAFFLRRCLGEESSEFLCRDPIVLMMR